MKLTIYLNPEGNAFKIIRSERVEGVLLFPPLMKAEAESIHPIIGQVFSSDGKVAVASALRALKEVVQQDLINRTSSFFQNHQQVNKYENYVIKGDGVQEDIQLSIRHSHAPYFGHNDVKGGSHHDTFETMIEFVEDSNRIRDDLSDPGCTLL